MSHGGPTAATHPLINFRIQYYTTPRLGRRRRELRRLQRLRTRLPRTARRPVGRGRRARLRRSRRTSRARPTASIANRVAIRGGSAGGYTTLAALTFGNTFRAGASHYGIGDLETLARDTHKFESRYLDRLIGPYPQARDLYVERSPIHHVDRLTVPGHVLSGSRRPRGAAESGRGDGRRVAAPTVCRSRTSLSKASNTVSGKPRTSDARSKASICSSRASSDSNRPIRCRRSKSSSSAHTCRRRFDEQRSRRRHCRRQI